MDFQWSFDIFDTRFVPARGFREHKAALGHTYDDADSDGDGQGGLGGVLRFQGGLVHNGSSHYQK
jgi:hypothetical protein